MSRRETNFILTIVAGFSHAFWSTLIRHLFALLHGG